jgi:hypothetical protein
VTDIDPARPAELTERERARVAENFPRGRRRRCGPRDPRVAFQINAGVFMPPGDPWTIGIAHAENDLARSVEAFDAFAIDVTA